MSMSVEETEGELGQATHVERPRSRWEKPLLILVLALAGGLMVAWLLFLGWIASLLLFAMWP